MAKAVTPQKFRQKDYITGLLLGFLISIFLLLIIKPMLMPKPAVAPVDFKMMN